MIKLKTFILNNDESKTMLNMVDDCIDKGLVKDNYKIDKINDIINYSYKLCGEQKRYEIEVIVKIKADPPIRLKTSNLRIGY